MTVADRRITIIGGAGFIGHNLALHLKALGADVSIIDGLEVNNLTSVLGNTDKLPHPQLSYGVITERLRLLQDAKIPLLVQDARDYHALSHLLTRIEPAGHHPSGGGVARATDPTRIPTSTFDHSLRTLENALDFARPTSSTSSSSRRAWSTATSRTAPWTRTPRASRSASTAH